jgi:hypothetical protein
MESIGHGHRKVRVVVKKDDKQITFKLKATAVTEIWLEDGSVEIETVVNNDSSFSELLEKVKIEIREKVSQGAFSYDQILDIKL